MYITYFTKFSKVFKAFDFLSIFLHLHKMEYKVDARILKLEES